MTGGAGFIGSSVVRFCLKEPSITKVLNLDSLTYAGSLANVAEVENDPRYEFVKGDIRDAGFVSDLFLRENPDAVIHLAAESHVDRSIDGPQIFLETNIMGTSHLLEAFRHVWLNAPPKKKSQMRFLHVSTDEVFGSLGTDGFFTETTPYQPNSPYSASKASADHLVRAWGHTYGMPFLITNCSNNYGPYQLPEKLIPLMILNALDGKPLPVYGKGDNVRDWLYVEDHARALLTVLLRGKVGESYNIGGNQERTNLQVVEAICDLLDEMKPASEPRRRLVSFVKDRPGHDLRYAIDAQKISSDLGWEPQETFESGLRKSVEWYLAQKDEWCHEIEAHHNVRSRRGVTVSTSI